MAASPIATAVFRPTVSISTRLRAAAGTCLRTAAACSAFVTVQMRSAEISGFRRETVCGSIVSLPTMLRSCLGVRVRLRGQKRVPRPPARITAWICSFSVGIAIFLKFFVRIARSRDDQARFILWIVVTTSEFCGNEPALTRLVNKLAGMARAKHPLMCGRPGNCPFSFKNDKQMEPITRMLRVHVNSLFNFKLPSRKIGAVHKVFANLLVEDEPFAGRYCIFFFNDTATTEIYTLSLHDALPISQPEGR